MDAEITAEVNSNPILFLRRLVQEQRPRLAVPESGDASTYLDWIAQVKAKVRELLGLEQMIPAQLEIAGFQRTYEGGLKRERFYLQTEPGYWAPVIVNIPAGEGPFTPILCLHGHVTNGKDGVSGIVANLAGYNLQALQEEMDHYNDTYAADLAQRGYLTVSLDNRDFNQAMNPMPYTYNEYSWHIAHITWLNTLGRTYAGCAVWDAARVLDYLVRRKDVDSSQVGCIGFSLGGLLTLYLTLLDSRIQTAVISGYFDSFLQRIVAGCGADCLCNYVPSLFAWLDIPDITAALAPRAVLVNLDGGDADALYEPVRRVYQALEAENHGEIYQYQAPFHRFSGERAYPWFEKWLPPVGKWAENG